jgi:hypothetical protein
MSGETRRSLLVHISFAGANEELVGEKLSNQASVSQKVRYLCYSKSRLYIFCSTCSYSTLATLSCADE